MRSSLSWGTEQCPQQQQQQQQPLETGRGKLMVHSITLCSVPQTPERGLEFQMLPKEVFLTLFYLSWSSRYHQLYHHPVLNTCSSRNCSSTAWFFSCAFPFLTVACWGEETWDPTLNTGLDLWRAVEKQLRENSVEQQVTSFPITIFFPRVIFSSFSDRSELLSVQGCVCTLLLTLTEGNGT